MLTFTSNDGQAIRTFADWATWGLPETRRLQHWKEGRSAFELARAWTETETPHAPPDLQHILDFCPHTRGLILDRGVVEHETPLPFGSRGPRCHDLVLWGRRADNRFLLSIEAKADEPFGATIACELEKALKRPVTRFPDRLHWLTCGLLDTPAFTAPNRLNPAIADISYQLLTAIGGTVVEAARGNAHAAIFLVHEFRTALTRDEKMDRNGDALDGFLRAFQAAQGLADQGLPLVSGHMIGPIPLRPILISPSFPAHIPLYIGKLRTDRTASL